MYDRTGLLGLETLLHASARFIPHLECVVVALQLLRKNTASVNDVRRFSILLCYTPRRARSLRTQVADVCGANKQRSKDHDKTQPPRCRVEIECGVVRRRIGRTLCRSGVGPDCRVSRRCCVQHLNRRGLQQRIDSASVAHCGAQQVVWPRGRWRGVCCVRVCKQKKQQHRTCAQHADAYACMHDALIASDRLASRRVVWSVTKERAFSKPQAQVQNSNYGV